MNTPTYEITITVGGSGQTTESKIGSVLPQGIITRQSGKIIATFVDAAGVAFDLSSLDSLDLFAKPFNSAEVPVNMGTGVISGAGSNIYTVSWVRDLIPAGWSSFAEDRDGTIVLYLELQETGTADFYQWSTRFNVEDGDYVGNASVLPLVNLIFYYNPLWGYSNTTVDADPGAGLFRMDDTVLANVTEMYIADDNQSTVDLSAMVQALGVGANIYLGNPNVKTDAACFVVSGAIVNNTGYSTIPVTFKSSGSSAFTNGTIISFSFMFTGLTDGSVTNAKLADMAQSTIKGRASGAGTGAPVDLTEAQTRAIIDVKGADVASATALPVIADGNYFDVTGTATVTSIDTVAIGAAITLQFSGILILTHHATNLILPTAANITTQAGDVVKFVEYAAADWRCVSYERADGTALVGGAGGGDVTGPGSAVDENIAVFNSTTGKIIKDGLINKSAIVANTAKTTNATHTGEVTGSGVLTVDPTAISNKSSVTAAATDTILIGDASDSNNLKKVTAQSIADLGSGGGGGSGIANTYTFDTTTTASDPGADGMRFNNATPASVTEIYINDDANGVDISTLIDFLSPGDTLYIQETATAANYILVTITSITDNTGWYTIVVTVDDSGTLPTNTGTVGIDFGRSSMSLDRQNIQTGTAYTGALSDAGGTVTMNNAASNIFTIPTNAAIPYKIDTIINILALGAGVTSVLGDTGVTVNGVSGGSNDLAQFGGTSIIKTATDTWTLLVGAVHTAIVGLYTKQQNFGTATLVDGANISWDLDDEQAAKVTLDGNRTLDDPTNMVDGGTYILRVIQDGVTGSRTLAYGSAYLWVGGVAPVLSTAVDSVDLITFTSDGTSMFGVISKGFS